jgi:hypothetical protein
VKRSRKQLVVLGFGTASLGLALGAMTTEIGAGAAGSGPSTMTFPMTVVTGEFGSVHQVASSDVAADMVGDVCDVTASADNNGSVHPQSDLIVSSDGTQVTIANVEAVPGAVTIANGELTLGSTITVSVRLGPDGVFSGGGSVELVCTDASPAPTEQSTTTSTTVPSAAVAGITQSRPEVAAAAVAASPGFTG